MEYGPDNTEKGLRRMIQLAERFPDGEIVATLSRQLGWSHFVELLPLDDPLKRDFSVIARAHKVDPIGRKSGRGEAAEPAWQEKPSAGASGRGVDVL
jgi:hypothetical protein